MGVGNGKIAILLNGPPRAGKDTAVNALVEMFGAEAEVFKFTRPVKDITHARYGLDCPHDAFEATKDTALPEFGGLTPREAYIETSASLKAERGDDAVRNLFVEAVMASPARIILNPDVGDDLEAESVAAALGVDNVLVLRIHRDGHDFSKDCRSFVTSARLNILDVRNEGAQEDYQRSVQEIASQFTGELVYAPPSRGGKFDPLAFARAVLQV